jgi:hypothetical protein
VDGSFADLGVTERRLSMVRDIVSKNIRCCQNSFASGAGLFLEAS